MMTNNSFNFRDKKVALVGYDSETGTDLSQLGADEINHLDGSMLDWVNAGGNLDFPDTISFNVSSYISHTKLTRASLF